MGTACILNPEQHSSIGMTGIAQCTLPSMRETLRSISSTVRKKTNVTDAGVGWGGGEGGGSLVGTALAQKLGPELRA